MLPIPAYARPLSLVRRWLPWCLIALILTCVVVWYCTRETLPKTIRVASGQQGGLYYMLASSLGERLAERTGCAVEIVNTAGSVDNHGRLLSGQADLAIIQSGSVSIHQLAALAPLYQEPVLVLARRGTGIDDVTDLFDRPFIVGPPGSGMRETAERVLKHFRVDVPDDDLGNAYFADIEARVEADAALVATGLLNPDLCRLMDSNIELKVVSIGDVGALCLRQPFDFQPSTVPRGFFSERPAVPAQDVHTVATTALLVSRADASEPLIEAALAALYETDVRQQIPTVMSAKQAQVWDQVPLHEAARRYFDPYGGLGVVTNLIESLSGIKELLFALTAALYLVTQKWRRMKANQQAQEVALLKSRLDHLLEETVRIERAQMHMTDTKLLEQCLDEVTTIKLKALEELTHEDLRGDNHFAIFLAQCANLIRKIQSKIDYYDRASR